MRAWNWPVIGFFALMAILIVIGVIDALEPAFCDPGKLAAAAKQQDVVVFRCWEFWLNRYQTLGAALLSMAVAFVLVRPVYWQLREMTKQTSSEARQIVRERIQELKNEIDAFSKLRAEGSLIESITPMIPTDNWINQGRFMLQQTIRDRITDFNTARSAVFQFSETEPNSENIASLKNSIYRDCAYIAGIMITLSAEVNRGLGGGPVSDAQIANDIESCKEFIDQQHRAIFEVIADRQIEIARERLEIRRLEGAIRERH